MSLLGLWICTASAFFLVACGPADGAVEQPPERPAVVIPQRGAFAELDRQAVRLSPDGRQIAFLAPLGDADALWLAPAADLGAARPLTGASEPPVERLWWAYGGDYLLFLQASEAGGAHRLFALTVADGERRALTPAGQEADLVHLSPTHPEAAMVTVAGADDGLPDLYELDLASGDLDKVAENEHFASWGVDDDLDLRLAFAPTDDGGMRVCQQGETGDWVDVSWVPTRDLPQTRFLGFDGTARVAYYLDSRGRSAAALVASDVTTGDARVLFQDPAADVADVLVHPVRKTVQAVASARARRQWRILDEDVRSDFGVLAGLGAGDLEIVDRSLDDRVWLAAVVPFDGPRRFYRYDRGTHQAELLFAGKPEDVVALARPAAAPVAAGSSR